MNSPLLGTYSIVAGTGAKALPTYSIKDVLTALFRIFHKTDIGADDLGPLAASCGGLSLDETVNVVKMAGLGLGGGIPDSGFFEIAERFYYFFCRQIVASSLLDSGFECLGAPAEEGNSNRICQFWDTDQIPPDVLQLLSLWQRTVPDGAYRLFSAEAAREFIAFNFPATFVEAYEYCFHPAMKSDYFRLAYIYICGGIYIDADDKLVTEIPAIDFKGKEFLVLNPIIRHVVDEELVGVGASDYARSPEAFGAPECYFDNAPLIASPKHPVVRTALLRCTDLILAAKGASGRCDIHQTTGPTNLTVSTVAYMLQAAFCGRASPSVFALDWSRYGCRQQLEYKSDLRNWGIFERHGSS